MRSKHLTAIWLAVVFAANAVSGPVYAADQSALFGLLQLGGGKNPTKFKRPRAKPADKALRPGVDEMGQPLYSPSNYDAVVQLKKIVAEAKAETASKTMYKLWRWSKYTVPDAKQRLEDRRERAEDEDEKWARIDTAENSTFGAIAYLIAEIAGADQETKDNALQTAALCSNMVLAGAGSAYIQGINQPVPQLFGTGYYSLPTIRAR